MFVAALACTTVLFVLVLLQFFWSRRFAELFQPAHTESQHAEASPKAVVLLSLRGADPFLGDCIRGLLNQTYTNFDARIIVDSREDQAWNVVQDLLREYDTDSSVSIEVIEKRHGTCTLKLSALIQAIESLDDSYDVVAFLDADVCPHPEWLADLVAPFADPVVGATTGLRYYQAAYSNAGTLVRYLWNLAALLQMQAFRIAWGGTLSVRASVFRDSDLLDKWSKFVFEDTHTFDALQKMGLELRVVSAATMPNRERIPLRSCCRFIRRQMLNTRLYHSKWPSILAFGVICTGSLLVSQGLLIASAFMGDWAVAAVTSGSVIAYAVANVLIGFSQESNMGRVVETNGAPRVTPPWQVFFVGLTLQFVYLWCLVSVLWVRKIDWRGITYDIQGPTKVRMREYSPYCPAELVADISIT